MSKVVALDIETTGLRPDDHQVVAVGIATESGSRVFVGEERTVLLDLERHLRQFLAGSLLVTWNGEEFDLPFLYRRMRSLEITSTLELCPRGTTGKYGKPQFEARWGATRHFDIAPAFEARARQLDVKWSLKPVARALLHVVPVEVDNRGEAIAAMSADALIRYVISDAEITLGLASYLNSQGEFRQMDPSLVSS